MACLFQEKRENNQQMIDQAVRQAHVKALRDALMKVVHEECYGCQVDHPSQKQHDVCLFMTFDEQVHCFLMNSKPSRTA